MSFSIDNGMLMIGTSAIGGLAVAMCMLMLGYVLRRKIQFFEKCCFPAAVVGGLLFALIHFALHQTGVAEISLDTTFQSPAMVTFFTCIGFSADFKTIKKGGLLLVVYWLFCAVLAVAQNTLAFGMSYVVNISPVYAVLAGTTTMMGGHGNGGAFGLTAQEMGYAAGQAVGLACATFGLISGSLAGGPFARSIIERKKLSPSTDDWEYAQEIAKESSTRPAADLHSVLKTVTFIAVTMTIGAIAADFISRFLGDVTLPNYVGGMFMGAILRNVNEKFHFIDLDFMLIDRISEIMLSVYLALAMSSMLLWQLIDLFVPLLIILGCQLVFVLLYARVLVFPTLTKVGGNGYDAAVMCSGLLGHGLGATPNAIANMEAVTEKYGPSKKAMLVVPLVASVLIDFVMIPTIVTFFNIAIGA